MIFTGLQPWVRHARVALLMACVISLTSACASITSDRVASKLARAEDLAGARWGVVVETLERRPLVSIRGEERFIPASNTKLFVAAAVFAHLPDVSQPDLSAAASIHLEPVEGGAPDLVIVGRGDGMLRDDPDCERDCLAHLVEVVTQNRIERVRSVIADSTLFPDERWPSGMSWNNIPTRSGTAMSALSINDNEVVLFVSPGDRDGGPALAKWREGDNFMEVRTEAITIAAGESDLRISRLPGENTIRVYGVIAASSREISLRLGVDDPALFAAWRLTQLLKQAGITVDAPPQVRHRAPSMMDDPDVRAEAPPAHANPVGVELGRVLPLPTADDIRHTLKVSQNLHAELFLRRLGLIDGVGSAADGHKVIAAMMTEAGAPPGAYTFADGSGMSTYNRVTPQTVVDFLHWTQTQSWGAAFREALPVGGIDGTLARRFAGTALDRRIFAKTGSLSAVSALSGFMIAASGRELVFSIIVNDWPPGGSATAAMDAALLDIAARN